ncbi:MAG: hypothetical protein ACM31C_11250 [Acidobacteriota bacterium]
MRAVIATVFVMACYAPHPPAGSPCANGACPSGLVCSPASQTCELVAVDAPGGIDAPVIDARVDASIDGARSPFAYRRRITIHNTSTTDLPAGFAIRVSLDPTLATLLTQGKVKADLSDLRVIGDGSLGDRDRIVDPATGPAPPAVTFALALPIAAGATDTSYALYYGNPAATAAPADGTKVFAIYDDFTAGIAGFWLKNDGPITSSGKLVLRAGHTDALTTAAGSLQIVSAVELVANVIDPTSNSTTVPDGTFYYWFGYQHRGDFSASDPWILWIARGKSQIHTEQKSPTGCETECDGPATLAQNTAPHYYAIERDPSATRFYLDGALSTTTSVMNTADYSVMVRNYMATSDLDVDYIRARPRVTPDPTATLGAEEQL